jgi:hypothetical protein
MANKVTGNPYEHFNYIRGVYLENCLENCPACAYKAGYDKAFEEIGRVGIILTSTDALKQAENSFKAGQKSGRQEVVDWAEAQLNADQLILDAELAKKDELINLLSFEIGAYQGRVAELEAESARRSDAVKLWRTRSNGLEAELQDNANIHAGLMSVSNEAIKALEYKLKDALKQLDESMASYYKVLELKRQATAHVEELKTKLAEAK